ncbi:TIGR00730 family Rossman fold protein [Trinickia fusca]|uniref:Cytokinin riboside 5'-monophosphate phosphoribohydrolase n=1 Tax=Trinickia fusca TaxID=2419777 RepID=A0A494X6T1_9BURK|nr:TIGR00730 family Rossman fold protein [Trinickia fusca]RKP43709.1 TIGR00730 family Rossman fold protein [Trinickia fusca]
MKSICVYCGSSPGAKPVYAQAARAFGQALVREGCSLVYGGGRVGLMGIIADAVLEAGGQAIGVIPKLLVDREIGHPGLTELHVVPDMHERKKKMADLADAFVALPGGAGTLEELFEVYTWSHLGYHNKPIGLYDVEGYYRPLVAMLEHTVREGFLRQNYVDALQVDAHAPGLIDKLRRYRPPGSDKWALERDAV